MVVIPKNFCLFQVTTALDFVSIPVQPYLEEEGDTGDGEIKEPLRYWGQKQDVYL